MNPRWFALSIFSHGLMIALGMLLGSILTLLDFNQISLQIGPPTTPIVVYNQTDNHYLAEVSAPSSVVIHGAGSASLTVNIPDQIEFREVVPSPPPTLTPEMDQQLDALLHDQRTNGFDGYEHMSTHRVVLPDQILSPEGLVIGSYVDYYNSKFGFFGTYMVAGPIYYEEVAGQLVPFIDTVNEMGTIFRMSLEDMSILPYETGVWNNVNRLFKAPIPAVPYPLPGDKDDEAPRFDHFDRRLNAD